MDFKDIELFLTLFNEKNVTRTAQKLFLSQSAITKRIKKIELFLNKVLLIRKHDGIEFTTDGIKFYQHCKRLSDRYHFMIEDLSLTNDQVSGNITLAVSPIFASNRLPQLIKDFSVSHPNVTFQVTVERSKEIYRMIREKECMLAIFREGYPWSFEKKLLLNEKVYLAYKNEVSIEDLAQINYIKSQRDPHFDYQVEHWWKERFSFLPLTFIETNNIANALDYVRAGLGWSIFTETALDEFDGFKQNLNWQNDQPFNRSFWLYYETVVTKNPVVKSFLNFVENYDFKIK